MSQFTLILFSRNGCCLCEGLEGSLRSLPLRDLEPSLTLFVIDIDGNHVSKAERARYDLRVPVMAISLQDSKNYFELPRVSPRLQDRALFSWLQKELEKLCKSD